MDDPYGSSGSEAPPPYLGGTQPPGISERMQALMSRAEQEVAEQRQLQSLVADVRQSLQQIHDEVRQAAGAHTLENVRGEVTSLGSEIRSATTMLGERLEAVVRAVGAGAQVMQGVGQQLDRVTELLNHQQEQLAALAATVTQQGAIREDVTNVRDDVSSVRQEVGGVRQEVDGVRGEVTALGERVQGEVTTLGERVQGEVTTLGERVESVAGQVRSDTTEALNALAERIDAAVLALAEALLRPRGAAVEVDAPTTSTMTMPVTSPPPWAGAAREPEETSAEATPSEPEVEPETEDDTEDDTDTDTEDATDTETDVVEDAAAAAEGVPAADATVAEAAPVEETDETPAVEAEPVEAGESPAGADTEDDTTGDSGDTDDTEDDTEDDTPDEVPLSAWAADQAPDEAAGSAFEAAFQESGDEPEAQPSSWGWDNVREPDAEDTREKRRPWWRPGG